MLSAEDIKEFEQLRQRLQPSLNRETNDLLRRVKGEIGAGLTVVPVLKLSEKQQIAEAKRQFL